MKPQRPRVNWAHPLANGLKFAMWFENTGWYAEASTGVIKMTPDGDPTRGVADGTTVGEFDGNDKLVDPRSSADLRVIKGRPMSAYARFRVDAMTENLGAFCCNYLSSTRNFIFGTRDDSGTFKVESLLFTDGQTKQTRSSALTAGQWYTAGMQWDGVSTSAPDVYLNGVDDSNVTLNQTFTGNNKPDNGFRIGRTVGDAFGLDGALSWVLVYLGVTHSAAQAKALYENPYQILEPRLQYIPVPAAAAAEEILLVPSDTPQIRKPD